MTSLGNYHHDFPRLAKQSGYFFQLYRGRVNWLEIENLNIDDIIENRNFGLLEQNLLNVVNCNIEREYDLKILDQKFVKLFKLAQLGVDYLSYCEMYLDRCVVLLQEQVIAFQQECELLKEENKKKTEELRQSKKKNITQKHQCDKCEKVFISEVYLKYHDKRRHSTLGTPKSGDTGAKKCIDTYQQTEVEKELSNVSTQTFISQNEVLVEQETEEIRKIKKENNLKMENLEKEMENLKDRLKKAESTLTEKTEASNSNAPSSVNYPGPIFYPPMLPFFPPYLPQPQSNYYEFNRGYQLSVPESCPLASPHTFSSESLVEVKASSQNPFFVSREEEKKEMPEEILIEVSAKTENFFIPREPQKKMGKKADLDKENINPNAQLEVKPTNAIKPPPPPVSKKRNGSYRTPLLVEELTTVKPFFANGRGIHSESLTALSSQSVTCASTSNKEDDVFDRESLEDIKLPETKISCGSLINDKVVTVETNSKSSLKKVVRRKAPKLQNLGKNLRRSLTILYDSVSGKNSPNSKESKSEDLKNASVDGLNNRLRELGIDPDWSGIPKKTMNQKLRDLKCRRKLLAKENPMFSIVRQNLEKTIFASRKSLAMNKMVVANKKIKEEPFMETANSSKTQIQKPEVKKAVMYDVDSETEISDLDEEKVFNSRPIFRQRVGFGVNVSEPEVEDVVEDVKRETDLSVFQESLNNSKSSIVNGSREENSEDQLHLESDFDDFLEDFNDENLKTIASYFDDKEKIVNSETDGFFISGKDKGENISILKSSHLKPHLTSNKKVLFTKDSHKLNKNLSDDESEDELWFLESERKKDMG